MTNGVKKKKKNREGLKVFFSQKHFNSFQTTFRETQKLHTMRCVQTREHKSL